MNRNSVLVTAMVCATVVVVSAIDVRAGDINPPLGPVNSTMKALDIVEPRIAIGPDTTPGDATATFVIRGPGSYYLTGNFFAEVGKHGIRIAWSRVTLDLNGFRIDGSPATLSGIISNNSEIVVYNGFIQDFPGAGIVVVGPQNEVRNVLVRDCGTGIDLGVTSIVTNCRINSCDGNGIVVGANSIVRGCVSRMNTGVGIEVGIRSLVHGCVSVLNAGNGYLVGDGSMITTCVAGGNTGHGIIGSVSCSIVDNIVTGSGMDGIHCGADNLITGNACDQNGLAGLFAGIHSTGADNRIEDNHMTDADIGLRCDAGGSFIVRNTTSGNTTTNYQIAGGNSLGTIRNTPVGAGPWDNFEIP